MKEVAENNEKNIALHDRKLSPHANHKHEKQPCIKNIMILHSSVCGMEFQKNIRRLVGNINKGDCLLLEREPDNLFDIFAIRLLDHERNCLGYLPKPTNETIARLMDSGKKLYAEVTVSDINVLGKHHEYVNDKSLEPLRFEVNVWLQEILDVNVNSEHGSGVESPSEEIYNSLKQSEKGTDNRYGFDYLWERHYHLGFHDCPLSDIPRTGRGPWKFFAVVYCNDDERYFFNQIYEGTLQVFNTTDKSLAEKAIETIDNPISFEDEKNLVIIEEKLVNYFRRCDKFDKRFDRGRWQQLITACNDFYDATGNEV